MITIIELYYEENSSPIIYHTDQECVISSNLLTIYDFDNDEYVTFELSRYYKIVMR